MKTPLVVALLVGVSGPALAGPVKQSRSKICHDQASQYYDRVKHYKAFSSIQACLDDGGRLPKQAGKTSIPSQKMPAYSRSSFDHWIDSDGDCQNTRHEILIELSTSTVDFGSNRCTVSRGRWNDPYTGKIFYEARKMDIDHLVPLKWAWDHGAYTWSDSKREQFANDRRNLFAVDASTNREKGAQGPMSWLPPNEQFHCQYVTRFIRVLRLYGLNVSEKLEAKRASVCVARSASK